MEAFKKHWQYATMVIAFVGCCFYVRSGVEAGEAAREQSQQTAQKVDNLEKSSIEMATALKTQADIIWVLLGTRGFDPEDIKKWQSLPTSPQLDEVTGLIKIEQEWIVPTPKKGLIIKLRDSAKYDTVVAWDFTKEKK